MIRTAHLCRKVLRKPEALPPVRFEFDARLRDVPANLSSVLSAFDQARFSPFPPLGARFGRSLNSPSRSRLFVIVRQRSERGLRISGESRPHTLHEPVVPEPSARDRLVVRFPGWLGETCQKRFGESVRERKKSLLSEPNATQFAEDSIEAGGNSFLGGIDTAFASGELSFNGSADECIRVREATLFRCALYPFEKSFLNTKSTTDRNAFGCFHSRYAALPRVRDSRAQMCTRLASLCTRQTHLGHALVPENRACHAQSLYVPLPVFWGHMLSGWPLLIETFAQASETF
jgi:hypothetical protein